MRTAVLAPSLGPGARDDDDEATPRTARPSLETLSFLVFGFMFSSLADRWNSDGHYPSEPGTRPLRVLKFCESSGRRRTVDALQRWL